MNGTAPFRAETYTLPNGVRALLLPRPHSPTLALQILVRTGSRHDGAYAGLAHLVEHLVFRAPDAHRLDLYDAVESRGGEVGGGTTRDYTSFEIVLAAPHTAQALALLPALARGPTTDPAAFAGEQRVVCAEIREREGSNTLWDLLLAALWGDHALVHAPAGTTDSVLAATPQAAAALHARGYQASHLLVVGAGPCEPAAFQAAVETALGDLPSASPGPEVPAPAVHPRRTRHARSEAPFVQVAVGAAVAGLEHDDCPALRLLDVLLGHGLDSRLARALAADDLATTVVSRYLPYAGAGAFALLTTCPRERVAAVADTLARTLQGLAADPPTVAELAAAQARYTGAVYRRCETALGLGSTAGAEALFLDGPVLEHTVTRPSALTRDEVVAVAERYFRDPILARATIGPGGETDGS